MSEKMIYRHRLDYSNDQQNSSWNLLRSVNIAALFGAISTLTGSLYHYIDSIWLLHITAGYDAATIWDIFFLT